MNDSTIYDDTQAELDRLDINLAANAARIASRQLPVIWACDLVGRLTNHGSITWALGQREWRPNPATRYAAIAVRGGVVVWRCDDRGWLDTLMGTVTPLTTRADVWRMRQGVALRLADEARMLVA